MVKRGSLRWDEATLQDHAARQQRWARDDQRAKADAGAARAAAQPDAASSPTTIIPRERDVLQAVLAALRAHPRVAWVERMNVGAFKNANGQFVRVGFVGCADILGQLRDGRFLAVEVKRPGSKPTHEQVEFLGRVHRGNGVAFVAWSADDARKALV